MMPMPGPPPGQHSGGVSPGPHSHIVCGGCATLLMYPQSGAHNVRCQRCNHLTAIPQQAANTTDSQQIVCNGCRVLLSYPRGAHSVQCSLCSTITQVPVYGHVRCTGCSVTLMFPTGARSVKCSVCHMVTPVTEQPQAPGAAAPHAGGAGPSAQHQQQQQRPQQPPRQTVVVENPAEVDAQGNEIANIAVGVQDRQQ